MKTQIMTLNNQELTIAKYSAMRSVDGFAAALQMSKCNELVNRLRTGIVHGYFQKVDGSIREFWGTTMRSLANVKTASRIGTEPKLRYGQIPFIDCESGEWKSMRIGSFIGYGV